MTPSETVRGLVKSGVLLVNIISSNQYSHEIRVEAQQQMRLNITTNK